MKYTISSLSQKLIVSLDIEGGIYNEYILEFDQPSVVLQNDKVEILEVGEVMISIPFHHFGLINGEVPIDIENAFYKLQAFINTLDITIPSDGFSNNAQKSNLPEIALNRYRSISNSLNRKVAWVGDSVTMHTGFYMIDSRDSATITLDTPETFVINTISASGVCTSVTTHNLLVNSVIYSTTTANGFVNNTFYYVSEVISTTEFKIVSNAFAPITLTSGTGLAITISFASIYDNRVSRYAGAPMYKVTNGAFGSNGNTAANFLASVGNTAINLGFEQVVSFAPNLIIYSYGINDVRLGATTQAQLEAIISSTVEAFQTRLPNTDIILRMPNHLCYDSVTLTLYLGAGTTYAQTQSRSDALRLAYRAMIAKYPNVYVLDTQSGEGAIFSEKVPTATNIYMSDCLHPNIIDGQGAIFREVLLSIGNFGKTRIPLNVEPPKFYPALPTVELANATAQSSTTDYLIYPRILEDNTKYNFLFKGKRAASVKGSYWDVGKYKTESIEAKNYTNVIKSNDIAIVYGTLEYTAGSQGEYFDNGVAAFKLTTGNVGAQGNNFRITSLPAGYPMANGTLQEVAFYRARPTAQKRPANNDFDTTISLIDFTSGTTHKTIEQFSVCSVITGISNTAPSTGGTVTINKNGVTFATLTWANAATTATGSGTFFTDATRGIVFDEGDIVTVIVNVGFVGGTIPKIRLSNK